jgi:FADH2 O2-dependent halogenase
LEVQSPTDVTIIGGGIAGSMLATVLARQNVSVRVLESGIHPQFAIGESMIPETGAWFRLMALRYDVPELNYLSNFQGVRHHVSSACGIKRAFSYVYHRDGLPPQAAEFLQFPTLAPPIGPDTHFFRQDLDQWMLAAALRYGAQVHQGCKIKSVARKGSGWQVRTENGLAFESRFLIDGGGYRSPLVQLFGIREEPCRLRTNSRSIFTHMVCVRPWDDIMPLKRDMPYPFSQSTLHHVFQGGWLWVIPFNNHRESTNPLCSVGLQLDRNVHPDDSRPAQEQFADLLAHFPGIASQFNYARPVRPWIATGRLQYSSRCTTGEGFFLLPHAAGFIDPLFSSGLGFMAWTVNNLAAALISAKATDDWSIDRFRVIEEWTQKHFDHFDRIVSGAYVSFANFDLWNAWYRVWAIGNFHGGLGVISRCLRYLESGDCAHLTSPAAPLRGFGAADFNEYISLLDQAETQLLAFKANRVSGEDASRAIFKLIADTDFCPPQFGFGIPRRRSLGTFNFHRLQQLFWWSRSGAPKRIRDSFYGFSQVGVWKLFLTGFVKELARGISGISGFLHDVFVPWNRVKRMDIAVRERGNDAHMESGLSGAPLREER